MPNKRLIWCICPSRTATATKCPIAFSKPPMKKFSSAAIALLGEYLILFEKGVRWEPHTNTSDRLDNTINRPHPIWDQSVAHLVWEEIFSLSSQSNFTWGKDSKKGFSIYYESQRRAKKWIWYAKPITSSGNPKISFSSLLYNENPALEHESWAYRWCIRQELDFSFRLGQVECYRIMDGQDRKQPLTVLLNW